jgi:hypothetical protein
LEPSFDGNFLIEFRKGLNLKIKEDLIMKKSVKRLTIVLALMVMALCLGSGSYACYYNEPASSNYYLPNLQLDLRLNGDLLDSSGHQNNGTGTGQTQYTTSINDRGLTFGGSNYVDISDSASLNFGTGSFSMALWFKTSSTITSNVMIEKRDPNQNYKGYCLCLYTGRPFLQIGDGNAYYNFWPGYSAPTFNNGQWHYLGVSVLRNGSSVAVTLYVDGVQAYQGSIGQIGSISNTRNLGIGRDIYFSQYFNGALDDVSLFNTYLGSSCYQNDIQICRYNLFTSTDLDLSFDNTISDSSRYQNVTTGYGSFGYVASPNLYGISFNGTQYITVNNSPNLNFGTGDLTIACWFKTNSTQEVSTIIDKRNDIFQGYCLFLGQGIPCLQLGDENNYTNFYSPGGPAFNNNQWHFITVTVDRDSTSGLKIYVDGSLIYTANPTGRSGNTSNTVGLYVAKHKDVDSFNYQGCLDEVYLINRALTSTEATNLYQSNSR